MEEYKFEEGSSIILDLIRGVSAQVVVIGHGISFFGIFKFLHEPNFPWMQEIAVLIFFLLSGFLITYSTVKKKLNDVNYGFNHFFIDRFSRIYGAFIPAIFFVLTIDLISINITPESYNFESAFNLKTFIGNLFMFQDYPIFSFLAINVTSFGSARPFWTLAIEWWIYLWFGYIMLVILKNKKMTLLNILILTFLSIVPVYNLLKGRGDGLIVYWLFGAIIFIFSTLNLLVGISQKFKIFIVIILSGLSLVRAYLIMNAYDPIFAFLLAIVLWLLIDIYKNKNISIRIAQIIRFNASFSYTLYLVHYSILAFLKIHFSQNINPYLLFTIGFLISNIISILIGRYTEIYLTKKIKTFLYERIEDKRFLTRYKR
ncbi:MAG: acyltransferase [Saprospiraceae bacterium]|nr:acyltransferase [Saprospiraceae bacterium]